MINDKNFIVIQGWMVTELELKGNDLLIYAIIYGYSQGKQAKFEGSLQYLADWCGGTKQGVQKNLKNLVEKGYIVKEEEWKNGVKFVSYYATELYGGMQLSCTNNINNITSKENINYVNTKESFKKPTIEEVEEYCRERNNTVDAETFVNFYESKGWLVGKNKMKDWKACVRTWEKNRTSKHQTRYESMEEQKETSFDFEKEMQKMLKMNC